MSSDIYCRVYSIISSGPERLLKTQIFEKKANFLVKNIFWPLFSLITEHDKCRGIFCKGPEGLLTKSVQVIKFFCRIYEVVRNKHFKKRLFFR